jgi:hypothetical protein
MTDLEFRQAMWRLERRLFRLRQRVKAMAVRLAAIMDSMKGYG